MHTSQIAIASTSPSTRDSSLSSPHSTCFRSLSLSLLFSLSLSTLKRNHLRLHNECTHLRSPLNFNDWSQAFNPGQLPFITSSAHFLFLCLHCIKIWTFSHAWISVKDKGGPFLVLLAQLAMHSTPDPTNTAILGSSTILCKSWITRCAVRSLFLRRNKIPSQSQLPF